MAAAASQPQPQTQPRIQPQAEARPRQKPKAALRPKTRSRSKLRAAIRRRPAPKPPAAARPIPINPAAPAKYAGTYRIDSWQDLEKRDLYHFFYLQPGGDFLLGAEWPGRETSRAAGRWKIAGELLSLEGSISVSTNQGRWRVPFRRSYRIQVGEQGIRLEPMLAKNRFGLLGWPNAFNFFRTRVSPNLPSGRIPRDAEKLEALISKLRGSRG